MSILSKLKTEKKVEKEKDVLGGRTLVATGVHTYVIKLAYLQETEKGSIAFTLVGTDVEDGTEFRTTQYTTSGFDKGQSPTYTNAKGTFYLPGYNIANAIAALSCGEELTDLELTTKTIGIYNGKAGSEVPTEVEVALDMIGKKIALGVIHKIENKKEQNPATKKYDIVTNTKNEFNEVDRVFHAENLVTLVEAQSGNEDNPVFHDKWVAKYGNEPVNTYKEDPNNAPASTASGDSGTASSAPKKKLFGNKAS